MEFRRGKPADSAAIQAIERASATRFLDIGMPQIAQDEPTPRPVLLDRARNGRLLVACDRVPVAFVIFDDMEDHLYIEQIDVAPSHGGKRIGARLLRLVEDRARAGNRQGLLLSTFRHVPWNAPYYRRLGFVDIDDAALGPALLRIRQEHLRRGLDEAQRVFMRKALSLDPGTGEA